MDLNMEYAAHQSALMSAKAATDDNERNAHLLRATGIADRIGQFQLQLGAAAACAWCAANLALAAEA